MVPKPAPPIPNHNNRGTLPAATGGAAGSAFLGALGSLPVVAGASSPPELDGGGLIPAALPIASTLTNSPGTPLHVRVLPSRARLCSMTSPGKVTLHFTVAFERSTPLPTDSSVM